MKKLTSLLSVVAITFGIGACAMESSPEDAETLGQTSQALSKSGLPGRNFGGIGGGGLILDPNPPPPPQPSWQCPLVEQETCGWHLVQEYGQYVCVRDCIPNGGFALQWTPPCGVLYPKYYCNSYGTCECRR